MRYASVCSGIEAATVAWHPIGWTPAWFSEIDRFPCAVLKHHYPDVPNLGDMTKIRTKDHGRFDLLVGGTPCQSFSVAGLRKGLDDPRGNLALEFLRLADEARPAWVVWENVPGVLSSSGGRDFGCFLGALGQLGYGWAYRVLDAQYCRVDGYERAVPQRRRRVFVVGYLGDWRRAAAVLFERESVCGDFAPSREAGPRVADGVARRLRARSNDPNQEDKGNYVVGQCHGNNVGPMGTLRKGGGGVQSGVPFVAFTQNQAGDVLTGDISPSMGTNSNATGRNTPKVAHTLKANGHDASEDGTGRGVPLTAVTLTRAGAGANDTELENIIPDRTVVRRLTPTECERLQGFPDDYTNIPYGRPRHDDVLCPDGTRYKALGNSMAVNVMRWIGRRIDMAQRVQRDS